MQLIKPQYRESNPKIDIYKGGWYWQSTQWYRSIAEYRTHNSIRKGDAYTQLQYAKGKR